MMPPIPAYAGRSEDDWKRALADARTIVWRTPNDYSVRILSAIDSIRGCASEDGYMRAVANVTEIASEIKAKGTVLMQEPGQFERGRELVDFADRLFSATAAPLPPK